MKKLLILTITLSFTVLISCSPSRDEVINKITKMETELKKSEKIDTNNVNTLLSAYQNFASRFADDSLAPEYLYKAAGIAVGFNKPAQAITIYQDIISKYPSYKKVPECYFMQAFTFENGLKNLAKANELYNAFIAKYPSHELSDDAASAIKFLGKTPEEMVKEFEMMQENKDSTATAVGK